MTPGRRTRYAEHAPRYIIEPLAVAQWQATIIDIGFGSGESVVAAALARPDDRILGVEVHEAGITHLLTDLARNDITNARVVRSDILEVMDHLATGSLREVCIFFPDPWPKVAHTQRRLVRADVVESLTDRLALGGLLRLATDADFYAAQMLEVCDNVPRLERTEAPERVLTKYERRGRAAGRDIVDLAYRRI